MSASITQRPVKTGFEGKAVDRYPDYPYAGVDSKVGRISVAECLKQPSNPCHTPDPCMRLRQWTAPPMQEQRIFPAQYYDPEMERSRNMIHGIDYPKGHGAAELINPIPKSVYQQCYNDKLESIYKSNKQKPLGHTPDPTPAFPEGFNYKDAVFGVQYKYNGNAKELLNPDKSAVQLHKEMVDDHDNYLVTHKTFYPGEQARRGYSAHPRFASMNYFGMPTPCNREGLLTKACLRWHTDRENEKVTPLVSKRHDAFRERTIPQIGKPLDPIKDTMIVAPNHVYGASSKTDLYKVHDLIHGRIPYYFNTGPHRERAVMGAIRNSLRALHYSHYKDLRDAFNLLDPENTGVLSEDQVRSVCRQFDLPVDPQLMEQVLDICQEGSNKINWHKFADNFNWQERIDFNEISPDYSYSGDPCDSNLADWNVQNRLQREVEREIGNWTTSNSMYNGGGILQGKHFPTLGEPSVRTDLPIPKVRKTTDKTSYGDEGGARCVINPSIMTLHGITEMDLLIPRKKDELCKLYMGLFANSTPPASFDQIWQLTEEIAHHQPGGKVIINIDAFSKAVTLYENQRIREEVEKKIPMLSGNLAAMMQDE